MARESLFAVADFRRLWCVGLVICVVRWLEMLALALYAYDITRSAFVVAMLPMLRLLPLSLFGAILGALAERFERRGALLLLLAVSLATSLALAVLATLGKILIWHLMVASFIGGITWAADHPVRRMLIGDVVGGDRLAPALAIDTATNNGSRVVGPMLGGILLAQYGVATVFWFTLALYVLGLAAMFRSGTRSHVVTASTSLFASVREGFAWAARDRRLIGVFAGTGIFNIFGWSCTSMIPVILTDYLRLDPQGVGLVAAAEGLGGLAGAILLARFSRPQWHGRLYIGSVGSYLVAVVIFAVSRFVALTTVALFAMGLCGAIFAVMQVTLVYRLSPVEMRARLLGVAAVCIGMGPIGLFYLGVLADAFTPAAAIIALAAQGFVALAVTQRFWGVTVRS